MENTNLPVLAEVQQLQKIVATAPAILSENQNSKDKAIYAGEQLFIFVEQNGMNDAIDSQLSTYIAKLNSTVKKMNERRKPFTQIVDAVKKQFTTIEAELKPVLERAQKLRDDYATEKMRIQREKEAAQALQFAKDKEAIELKKELEIQYNNYLISRYTNRKEMLYGNFNAFTLENIDNAKEWLREEWKRGCDFMQPLLVLTPIQYLDKEQANNILQDVLYADFSEKIQELTKEFQLECKILSDKIESRKAELSAIKNANAEEKTRLEKEAADRIVAEQERLKAEQIEAERKAAEQAEIAAVAQQAASFVDSAAVLVDEQLKVKEAYRINLTNVAGYLLLTQQWFEVEGKMLTDDKFEKFTFDRIKRWNEAYALKNEVFIQSPLIGYEPVTRRNNEYKRRQILSA